MFFLKKKNNINPKQKGNKKMLKRQKISFKKPRY